MKCWNHKSESGSKQLMQHKQMHYSIIYAYNLLHSSYMFLPAHTI